MRDLAILIFLASVSLIGCAGSSRTQTTETDDGTSISTGFSLHGSQDAALIDRGKQAVRNGDYLGAAEAFRAVAESGTASSQLRAEALLRLGQVHADPMNPGKDPEKAVSVFQRLVEEFPDSELRNEAEQRLARLREQMEDG